MVRNKLGLVMGEWPISAVETHLPNVHLKPRVTTFWKVAYQSALAQSPSVSRPPSDGPPTLGYLHA